MRKIFCFILILLMINLVSCHEIGIRQYSHKVSMSDFFLSYNEAYEKTRIKSFMNEDFKYYYDYEYVEVFGNKVEDKIMHYTTCNYSHDFDNKVVKIKTDSIRRDSVLTQEESKLSFYLNSENETIRVDDEKKESESIHKYEQLYLNCNYYLFILQETQFDDEHVFYVDDNVYTVYKYNKASDYEEAELIQITFKDDEIFYYKVEEKRSDSYSLVINTYVEFVFKNVYHNNKYR